MHTQVVPTLLYPHLQVLVLQLSNLHLLPAPLVSLSLLPILWPIQTIRRRLPSMTLSSLLLFRAQGALPLTRQSTMLITLSYRQGQLRRGPVLFVPIQLMQHVLSSDSLYTVTKHNPGLCFTCLPWGANSDQSTGHRNR